MTITLQRRGATIIEVLKVSSQNANSSQTNGWLARAASKAPQPLKGIMEFFINAMPGRGDPTTANDDALIIKTSPVIWEYEMFRLEWDRRTTLRELDVMLHSDPRVKRANKVFAATAVRRGVAIKVTSNVNEKLAEQAQGIIDQLIRDVQLNSKLTSWARILPKDGDLFLNPVLDMSTRRIVNIKRLPAITMQRNDDMTGNFPDRQKAFQQIDPISLQVLQEFPLWSVNHIRWNHEEGDRYGESQYLQIRGYWKKLDMTEQDLVVRRRTRAPLRRFHSVGDKDHPQSWDQIEKYKEINKLDPKKAQVTTDYFGNGLVSVANLEGDTSVDKIQDVVHLQEVYMMGTGVPLHILGFGQNVNRDIVAQQMEQFQEDMQELRTLLEWGDSSPYSGLRLILDFALALQGIDPTLVDYNWRWYENDNESSNDRVTRVVSLRGSANMHPDPLVTKKTALMLVAKDIGLENEAAVEAELQALAEETPIVAPAVVPATGDDGTGEGDNDLGAKPGKITDSLDPKKYPNLHSPGYNQPSGYFPLHGKAAAKMEMAIAKSTRKNFQMTFQAIEPEIEAYINKVKTLGPVYGDAVEYKPAHDSFEHILNLYEAAWVVNEESLINEYFNHYLMVAGTARSNAAKNMGIQVTADFTNPDILHYLQTQAAERVKGIGETTKDLLRNQLAQAYEKKETVAQWKARIAKVVNCDFPKGRAEMIARTELAHAYSKGLLATYQEGGVHQVQWMAVMDDRTCEECAGNDGEIFSLADAEDMLPAHPRCRCTCTAVNGYSIDEGE